MKLFRIITILSNYLSNIFGKNVIVYKIWATTCLIGIALEVWAVVKRETTLVSLQLEQTVTRTFLTSSEMKELVSRDFLISLLKIKSRSESKPFLSLRAS